jgi:hypothetical protein
MIDEKLLEIRFYNGEGFKPLVIFKSWRVAVLNYLDEIHPARITRMERHPETDEVFVLLRGKAVLFLGDGHTGLEAIHIQEMEPGVLYDVKPQTWHTVVMSREASVLLVENADTGEHNSEFIGLSREHCRFILETARRLQPGEWD